MMMDEVAKFNKERWEKDLGEMNAGPGSWDHFKAYLPPWIAAWAKKQQVKMNNLAISNIRKVFVRQEIGIRAVSSKLSVMKITRQACYNYRVTLVHPKEARLITF